MPSRSAHRAALRRSKEPTVIAPEGLGLPDLPGGYGWRNPVVADDYDRSRWEAYRVDPDMSRAVAWVHRDGEGRFFLRRGAQLLGDAVPMPDCFAAFATAARWAQEDALARLPPV